MHLRGACILPVLGRARRMNDRGVYHRALAQQQAVCAQVGIDRVEQVGREAVALQQTPEVEDGGLIGQRSEEHTSELQSLMRISYAVFCLKKKNTNTYKR